MLERLNTEEQLANYAGWFIPLKIEATGAAWQKWNQQYPSEGNTIPIVFVIRADGEMLYGKSGSLPGKELYQLLDSSLNNAGLQLTNQQIASVQQTVDKAKSSIEAEKPLLAIKELMRLSKLGAPGMIPSHAAAVTAANTLVTELSEKATAVLKEAETKIADKETRFDGLMQATKCSETYGRLPLVNKNIKSMRSQWSRDDEVKAVLKQVKRFRKLLKQTQKGKLNKKLAAIREFHGKHVKDDFLARRSLLLLDDLIESELSFDPETIIDWVAKSGDKIAGKLKVERDDSKVRIETAEGGLKSVQVDDLDTVSREIIKLQGEDAELK